MAYASCPLSSTELSELLDKNNKYSFSDSSSDIFGDSDNDYAQDEVIPVVEEESNLETVDMAPASVHQWVWQDLNVGNIRRQIPFMG